MLWANNEYNKLQQQHTPTRQTIKLANKQLPKAAAQTVPLGWHRTLRALFIYLTIYLHMYVHMYLSMHIDTCVSSRYMQSLNLFNRATSAAPMLTVCCLCLNVVIYSRRKNFIHIFIGLAKHTHTHS